MKNLADLRNILQTVTILWMAVLLAFPAFSAEITFPTSSLNIGNDRFTVELATTGPQQERGLMFRKSLPEGHGMLFIFREAHPVAMWMKNTPLPLDMIFIDERGRIINIAENTVPESLDIIRSGGDTKAVLELAAGTCKKRQIEVGEYVIHESFTGKPA